MAGDSEINYEEVLDASVEEALEDAAEAAAGSDGAGSLFGKLNLDTLILDKLFSGNVVAVCMAVTIATILVFLLYKLLTRQSRRDKSKEAKKKLKQQKNSTTTKENKKKV